MIKLIALANLFIFMSVGHGSSLENKLKSCSIHCDGGAFCSITGNNPSCYCSQGNAICRDDGGGKNKASYTEDLKFLEKVDSQN